MDTQIDRLLVGTHQHPSVCSCQPYRICCELHNSTRVPNQFPMPVALKTAAVPTITGNDSMSLRKPMSGFLRKGLLLMKKPVSSETTPISEPEQDTPPSTDCSEGSCTTLTPDSGSERSLLSNGSSTLARSLCPVTKKLLRTNLKAYDEEEIGPHALATSHTVVPIHKDINYHLSLDNLTCVRDSFDRPLNHFFVSKLSCSAKIDNISESQVKKSWSSELYFGNKTFLQKQEIILQYGPNNGSDKKPRDPVHFTSCPHQSVVLSDICTNLYYNGGVSVLVTNEPNRCTVHPSQMWEVQGSDHRSQIVSCTICRSDAECVAWEEGINLAIRFTCYRDLGPGNDVLDPSWRSLLTGEGSAVRSPHSFDAFKVTWKAAQALRRPGLSKEIHETPNGPFNVSEDSRGNRSMNFRDWEP